MLTNKMRHWLSRLRSQITGKPGRRHRSAAWGYSERLESRTVLTAQISTVGSAVVAAASDNSMATARDLGTLGATPTTVNDFVGNSDTQDFARFTIARQIDFRLQLSGLSADADVQLLDSQGRTISSSTRGSNLSEDITRSLEAGTYFVRVYQYAGDTNYVLNLSAAGTAMDDNSMAGAQELGTIGATPTNVSGFVGNSDTQDFTRFTIARPSDFRLQLTGMTADADVQLRDAQGMIVAGSQRADAQSEEIARVLEAGTYFVRVYQYSGDTNYTLTLSAVASDNSMATARDLGTISATPTTVHDFVGSSDTQDFFRFTLNQTRSVSLQLSGLSNDADVQILDAQGRIIATSNRGGIVTELINVTLTAGTYFVRVYQYSGDTNYDLTLSAT